MPEDAALIHQANYDEHLALLGDCDLVIEAIAERMDWKLDLYRKVAPALAPHAIVARNTSGLSITKLAEVLPEAIKPRFCGIHFFNPPRYMALVELIATPTTEPEILDQLETFVTTALGKSVVRAKDTPNFIANRVGIAGMLATMNEAEKFGLSYDVVDDLTGKKMGRASSGTFRTADVVGLDTMAHVIKTLQDNLAGDPFFASYATPPVLARLIEKGALGQKSGAGFYKKVGKDILRLDPANGEYVPGGGKADEIVARMLKKPPAERLKLLRESSNPQAQFLWAILRDSFHYAAVHLAEIAETARDVDFAMRWGFGASQGPFELWQAAGWKQVAEWIKADIEAGKALSSAPLPDWVFDRAGRRARRAHARRLVEPGRAALRRAAPAAGLRAPVLPRERARRRRAGAAEIGHRGVPQRRGPRLDARRRGADRQHHRQAAPDQPDGDRGPAEGGRARRAAVQGPGDLVARRRVLGRRQPRGADAGVHEERRQGHRARGEEAAGRDAADPLCQRAGGRGDPRHRARRRLRARGLFARGASRRWKATWAWSRSASG